MAFLKEKSDFWVKHDAFLRDNAKTMTARQIGDYLGVTRNAVLGYAMRNGISLSAPEKRGRIPFGGNAGSRKGRKINPSSRQHRPHAFGTSPFSLKEKGAALAGVWAGLSFRKAAELVGAGREVLYTQWQHKPEVKAEAEIIYARALDMARREKAARMAMQRLAKMKVQAHNEPLLNSMPARTRQIVERRLAGETLQVIGSDLGMTRERARQIFTAAVARHGIQSPPDVDIFR